MINILITNVLTFLNPNYLVKFVMKTKTQYKQGLTDFLNFGK